MSRRPLSLAALLGATGVIAPGVALAGGFDDRGVYQPDPAAVVAVGFEPDEVPDAPIVEVESPIEGAHALVLGLFEGIDVTIDLPVAAQHYRASAWVRGSEVVVDVEVFHGDPAFGIDAITQLFPTGRVTSDGWIELANDVRIDSRGETSARIGVFAARGAEIDAVEVVATEPFTSAELGVDAPGTNGLGSSCEGVTDGSGCPVGAVCLFGECRDVSGWVPPIPENRDQVADYLAARLELLFGPYINRELDLPVARLALEQMRGATDRWTYWNGFAQAVRRLHDGHTGTGNIGDFVVRNERPIGLCFLEGDADLSQGVAPADPRYLDVLVSHVGPDRNLGLSAGDRLVAVDGRHPIEWARSLIDVHWSISITSNHETYAELAEQMRGLIARYAATIDVVRCDREAGRCGAVETLVLDEVAPFHAEGEPYQVVACDNRPLRHLESSPPDHISESGASVYGGQILETEAEERLFGLEWESLGDGVASALGSWVQTWKSEEARGVLLDHRSGNGGTLEAPQVLWSFFVERHPSDAYLDRQRAEDPRPTLAEGQAIFARALERGYVDHAGLADPDGIDVPVALLLTRDISASDWLPLGFKGSPNARIFAPFETNGAFSTRYVLGYWLGLRYVLASGDTFVPSGETLNGQGVEPDQVVVPLQSDLVAGRDTVFEAALAWLRQESAARAGGRR